MKVGDLVKWHVSRYWCCGIIISIETQNGFGGEIKCYTVLWDDGILKSKVNEWQLFPYEKKNETR